MRRMTALLLLSLCLTISLPVLAQNNRWDGADNQPTDPLACGPLQTTEPAPSRFDGGQAIDPPQRAGQTINLVNIPPMAGSSYFDAVAQGMQFAARELGNVSLVTDAPGEANSSDQVIYVDNYVSRAVDGILVSATDGADIAPSLAAALDAGIHVVTYDGDSEHQSREWYVRPAETNVLAKMLVDQMAAEAGPSARFGIVTDSYSAWNQSRLISEMAAYARQCFPAMEWLETVEAQNDPVLAFNQAATLINTYQQDLDGVFGLTVGTTPSLAEAVVRSSLCGQVAVVGLGMPSDMGPYIEGGCVQSSILWNPLDLGYASVYVMRGVVDGSLGPRATSIDAGRLGTLPVINGSEVLLGQPLLITSRNVGDFDF